MSWPRRGTDRHPLSVVATFFRRLPIGSFAIAARSGVASEHGLKRFEPGELWLGFHHRGYAVETIDDLGVDPIPDPERGELDGEPANFV
jgi:hypothetical protein